MSFTHEYSNDLGAVYMSPVCRASPFKRGARFHYNFLLKIILLYMQTGLAHLGGISLDSNGAPGQLHGIKFVHVNT